MAGKTIKIISDQKNGLTPVHINGRGRDIPHNKEEPVTDDELAVLENSGIEYEVVGDASAKETRAAEDERTGPNKTEFSATIQSPQEPGGDNMSTDDPNAEDPVGKPAVPLDQEPGGDNMSGGVIHGAAPAATGEAPAPLAEAKTPALAKRDPLDRDNRDGPGGSINVAKILEGTVPEVLEAAEKLAPDQRAALKKAEKAGQNRNGIVNNL